MKSKFHYAWVITLVCGFLMFCMSAQQMSNSVYLARVAETLNLGMGDVSLAFSAATYAMIVMSPVAGKLYKRFPAKRLALLAVIMQCASLMVLSVANGPVLIVVASLLESFTTASFLVVLPAQMLKRWFRDRGQLAYNIILFISMLGGVVFTPIASAIIADAGWRVSYRVLGLFVLLVELPVVAIFLKESPESIGLKPFEDPNGDAADVVKNRPVLNADVTSKSAWKSRDFYLVCLFIAVMTYAGTIQAHLVKHLESIGFTSAIAATAVTAGMVGGLIGRVILGYTSEKLGLRVANLIYSGMGIVTGVALCFSQNSPIAFVLIMSFIFGLVIRSANVQNAMMKYRIFGASPDYSEIVANMYIISQLIAATASPVYGYIFDSTGSYTGGFIISVVSFLLSMLLVSLLLRSSKKRSLPSETKEAEGALPNAS